MSGQDAPFPADRLSRPVLDPLAGSDGTQRDIRLVPRDRIWGEERRLGLGSSSHLVSDGGVDGHGKGQSDWRFELQRDPPLTAQQDMESGPGCQSSGSLETQG
jgi:hypothetical protein